MYVAAQSFVYFLRPIPKELAKPASSFLAFICLFNFVLHRGVKLCLYSKQYITYSWLLGSWFSYGISIVFGEANKRETAELAQCKYILSFKILSHVNTPA